MRFAFVDDFVPAVVVEDRVVEVADVLESIPRLRPPDVFTGLITRWDEFAPKLEAAAQQRNEREANRN
jgi:hypothetical protein